MKYGHHANRHPESKGGKAFARFGRFKFYCYSGDVKKRLRRCVQKLRAKAKLAPIFDEIKNEVESRQGVIVMQKKVDRIIIDAIQYNLAKI